MASNLHWKYGLNVHFPTLLPSITQISCNTAEWRSRVDLLPTSPSNGNTHLFHCLEMLITQNIYCFRDTLKWNFSASSCLVFRNVLRAWDWESDRKRRKPEIDGKKE